MSNWQPIESAPRDGTRLRLKRIYKGYVVAEGEGFFGDVAILYAVEDGGPKTFRGVWVDGRSGSYFFPTPTHWQPREDAGGSFYARGQRSRIRAWGSTATSNRR